MVTLATMKHKVNSNILGDVAYVVQGQTEQGYVLSNAITKKSLVLLQKIVHRSFATIASSNNISYQLALLGQRSKELPYF